MKHSTPDSQPAGFHTDHYLTLMNYVSLQNPGLNGRIDIGKGALLFKFSNFQNEVKITIRLYELGGKTTLDETDVLAITNDSPQFVVFEDFPPHAQHASAMSFGR